MYLRILACFVTLIFSVSTAFGAGATLAGTTSCFEYQGDVYAPDGTHSLTPWFTTVFAVCSAMATGGSGTYGQGSIAVTVLSSSDDQCVLKRVSNKVDGVSTSEATSTRATINRAVPCGEQCKDKPAVVLNVTAGYGSVSGYSSDGRPYLKSQSGKPISDVSPPTVCFKGCSYSTAPEQGIPVISDKPTSSGLYRASIDQKYRSDESSCTASADDPTNTIAPGVCLGTPGTVNGKTVCIAGKPTDSSPSTAGRPVGTSNNDSPGSNPSTAPSKNSDGTSQTTGPNGELPGKSTDIAGQPTGVTGTSTIPVTSTSTTPNAGTTTQAQYCTDNPTAPACKNSSFGGACDSGFTCDGDAATCAVAKATNESYCQMEKALKPDDSSTPSLASQAANGTDESSADKLRQAASNAPVSVSSLDVTGRGWSRSCPSDPSFSLPFAGGRSFSIPFSRACGPLGLLANAAVGLTLLGALLWVLGGSKT